MDGTAREVQQVPGVEDRVEDRRADLRLIEVLGGVSREIIALVERLVQPPSLFTFDLQNKCLYVVVVRREALTVGRREVRIRADKAAEEFLKSSWGACDYYYCYY